MASLKDLFGLGGNDSKKSPNEIAELIETARELKLIDLDLSFSGLTDLPQALWELTHLHRLYAPNNKLSALREELCKLVKLEGLYIYGNQIRTLPKALKNLTELKYFAISKNQLTTLPNELGHLTQLRQLDVSDNQLLSLPESIGNLRQLQHLDLSENQLTGLPEALNNLTELQYLGVSKNHFSTLPNGLGQLTQLQRFDASYNQLASLPEAIGNLTQLHHLDLSMNRLRALPESLLRLTKLKTLYLQGNPDLDIPQEILGPLPQVGGGKKSEPVNASIILEYYFANKKRAVMHGTQPLNEAKVIVLGEAGVGKSSLILALTENKLKQSLAKTHGIVQKVWHSALPAGRLASSDDKDKELLQLNLWDFGGQEVYHSTHTFFLTHRAIYLLVSDARANDRQNNLEYWLQMAASFGAGSPVLVIVNKCDEHGAGPDEHALIRKYPNIRGFVRTSCFSGEGIDLLKEKLVAEALRLEGVRQPMNAVWLNIKRALESMKQDTVSLDEYRALCRKHGENEKGMPEKLLNLWDTLGTVRYFPDRPDDPLEMRESAILNPDWVTKAVYAVLDDSKVRNSGGLATHEDFVRILKNAGYSPQRSRMIEQVMRRFDLLYDTTESIPQQKVLIPQLLPEREPEHDWPTAGTLTFVYKYPVFPAALVPSFIARRHRLLSRSLSPWRHGCVLDFPNDIHARVIGDPGAKQVTISVTGNTVGMRDALTAVRATFEDMHANVQGLTVEELIPVPGRPDAPLLNYRLVQALKQTGKLTHFALGTRTNEIIEVDVEQALNAIQGNNEAKTTKKNISKTQDQFENTASITTTANLPSKTNIYTGHFSSSVVSKMESCTSIINQQNISKRRDLLQKIQLEVREVVSKLPEEQQIEAANDFEMLIKSSTEQRPNRKWYSISAQGLFEASKYIKDYTGNIAGIITELGKMAWPDFSLPEREKQ